MNRFDEVARFLRNGRDLGEYDHRDFTYQAFLSAALIALKAGTLPDGGNPYKHSRTQGAFTTFGQPYLLYLLAVVMQVALKACWYQKWLVHRRLRPEEYAGRVEVHLRKLAEMPLPDALLASAGLEETRKRFGTALLPQAYPEASGWPACRSRTSPTSWVTAISPPPRSTPRSRWSTCARTCPVSRGSCGDAVTQNRHSGGIRREGDS